MVLVKWVIEQNKYWTEVARKLMTPFENIHYALNATVNPGKMKCLDRMGSVFWEEAIKATTINRNREIENMKTEPMWNNKHTSSTLCARVVQCMRGMAWVCSMDIWWWR